MTVNRDELNCPARPAETLMDVQDLSTDEFAGGVAIVCPSCGFQIGSASGAVAEAAVRALHYGAWMEMLDA